jgi:O-antigen/teichoic acid export membrane protein
MKIFGSEFVAGSQALEVLAMSQLINAFSGPAGQMVLMSGHSKMELFNITVSLIVNITFCFLLIPGYGIIGAALANVAATIMINLVRAAEVWFLMHMHAYNFNYLKPLLAAAVTMIVVSLAGRYVIGNTGAKGVVALATCMLVIYMAVTVILGLSKQDKAVLELVKKRLMQLGVGGA